MRLNYPFGCIPLLGTPYISHRCCFFFSRGVTEESFFKMAPFPTLAPQYRVRASGCPPLRYKIYPALKIFLFFPFSKWLSRSDKQIDLNPLSVWRCPSVLEKKAPFFRLLPKHPLASPLDRTIIPASPAKSSSSFPLFL